MGGLKNLAVGFGDCIVSHVGNDGDSVGERLAAVVGKEEIRGESANDQSEAYGWRGAEQAGQLGAWKGLGM